MLVTVSAISKCCPKCQSQKQVWSCIFALNCYCYINCCCCFGKVFLTSFFLLKIKLCQTLLQTLWCTETRRVLEHVHVCLGFPVTWLPYPCYGCKQAVDTYRWTQTSSVAQAQGVHSRLNGGPSPTLCTGDRRRYLLLHCFFLQIPKLPCALQPKIHASHAAGCPGILMMQGLKLLLV